MKALATVFASKTGTHFWEGVCISFSTTALALETSHAEINAMTWAIIIVGSFGAGFKAVVSLNSEPDAAPDKVSSQIDLGTKKEVTAVIETTEQTKEKTT